MHSAVRCWIVVPWLLRVAPSVRHGFAFRRRLRCALNSADQGRGSAQDSSRILKTSQDFSTFLKIPQEFSRILKNAEEFLRRPPRGGLERQMWAAGSLRSPASLPAAEKFHWSGGAAAHPRAENFLRGVGSRRGSLSSVCQQADPEIHVF